MKRSELKRGTSKLKRTELKRGTKNLERSKRVKPISDKRRAAIPARNECRRIVFERAHGRCEACPKLRRGQTPRDAVDVHEILTRARAGDVIAAITDPDNCLAVCRPCHDWITDGTNDAEACAHGLLKHSWDR